MIVLLWDSTFNCKVKSTYEGKLSLKVSVCRKAGWKQQVENRMLQNSVFLQYPPHREKLRVMDRSFLKKQGLQDSEINVWVNIGNIKLSYILNASEWVKLDFQACNIVFLNMRVATSGHTWRYVKQCSAVLLCQIEYILTSGSVSRCSWAFFIGTLEDHHYHKGCQEDVQNNGQSQKSWIQLITVLTYWRWNKDSKK